MKKFIIDQWEKGMESNHPFNRHIMGLALAAGLIGATLGFFIGLFFLPI